MHTRKPVIGIKQKGDGTMKKQSRVVLFTAVCLVGFIGQISAFGASTNSVWDLTSISVFKVAKIHQRPYEFGDRLVFQ